MSVGSVLATGVRPGLRVPVMAATGDSEFPVPSAGMSDGLLLPATWTGTLCVPSCWEKEAVV